MIGAISNKQNGAVQVRLQGSKDRQPRRTRKPKASDGFACVKLNQQLLVSRKRTDVGKKGLHSLRKVEVWKLNWDMFTFQSLLAHFSVEFIHR